MAKSSGLLDDFPVEQAHVDNPAGLPLLPGAGKPRMGSGEAHQSPDTPSEQQRVEPVAFHPAPPTHEIVAVKVADCIETKSNSRRARSPIRIAQLAQELKHGRQEAYITVIPGPAGKYLVVDGQTRVEAARQSGIPVLDARVRRDIRHDDHDAIYTLSKTLNAGEKLCDIDRGLFFAEEIAKGLHNIEEIVARENIAKRTIYAMMVFEQFPTELLAVCYEKPERFNYTIAGSINAYLNKTSVEAAIKLAREIVDREDKLAVKAVDKLIKSMMRDPNSSPRTRSLTPFRLPLAHEGTGSGEAEIKTKQGRSTIFIEYELLDQGIEASEILLNEIIAVINRHASADKAD